MPQARFHASGQVSRKRLTWDVSAKKKKEIYNICTRYAYLYYYISCEAKESKDK